MPQKGFWTVADEVRQIHLGYVPIADFDERDPAVQILALRGIAEDLSSPSWATLGDAVASRLDLVEATVKPRADAAG